MPRFRAVFPALLLAPGAVHAQEAPAGDRSGDEAIVVFGRAAEQVGVAASASEGIVGYGDFENRPLARVGELAENVPGLVATQHSGEGKANQFFLRGFNLDHGTDLAGTVDGAPINMRSHGHGQGYLDLNFLIPELVERIDYTKGPYHADKGDFASAGTLGFVTRSRFDAPLVEATGGSFGYWRGLAAGSFDAGGGDLLGALDVTSTDGPWVLDERLRKVSAMLKLSRRTWSLGLSGYTNRWNSTDQVPERAISEGIIPRNGAIDTTLGGRSGRIGLTFNGRFGATEVVAYAIASRLRLTSNFTYLLDDPVNGDQFRQVDRRGVFGGSVVQRLTLGGIAMRVGGEARYDRIGKVGLYRTTAGALRSTVREDRVDEASAGAFAEATVPLSRSLRAVIGLRADGIAYRVRSDLAANSGSGSAAIVTPKLALAWQAARGVELYGDYGEGFHSNDVRGATIRRDPATGELAQRVPVLVRSRGGEIGARIERGALTAALVGFWLDLGSELVFVGDAGATEPSAPSRRFGGELSLFVRPAPWLTLDAAAALTHARFRHVAPGEDRIPGAVPDVLNGGASVQAGPNLVFTLRARHFGSAPLIEDGSVRSRPTTLFNAGAYWTRGRVRVSLDALNLFDSDAPDISYFYASRLAGEPAGGVADRHVHPVEPRQLRLTLRHSF